jgi:hypothetical protein
MPRHAQPSLAQPSLARPRPVKIWPQHLALNTSSLLDPDDQLGRHARPLVNGLTGYTNPPAKLPFASGRRYGKPESIIVFHGLNMNMPIGLVNPPLSRYERL